jgi:hypothetical protein
MSEVRYLTKSRFKLALECPIKLFYTRKVKEYANQKTVDTFLQSLAKGGFQVEELARLHYPNGILIEGNDWNYDLLAEETKNLVSQENVTIYEAAFRFENLFIRTDIFVKKGNKVQLIEVKSRTFNSGDDDTFISKKGKIESKWRDVLYDLAFQKYVVQKCHPEWEVSAFLMLADKSKKSSIDGLNQLFRITEKAGKRTGIVKPDGLTLEDTGAPVLETVRVDQELEMIFSGKEKRLEMNFFELVKSFSEHYEQDKKYNYPVGWQCKACEFKLSKEDGSGLKSGFEECWKDQKKWTNDDFKKPKTFDIWDFRLGGKLLMEKDIIFMDQLKKEVVDFKPEAGKISRTERQWIQIEKARSGATTRHLELSGLKSEMSNWVPPYNFIDFETSAVALPFTKGRRPYEQVAFQFSHHKLYEDGRIEHHREFISNTPGEFPNFKFVRAIKQSLEDNEGTIFRYATHENSILNAIFDQLDASNESDKVELMDFIKTITVSRADRAEQWEGERKMIDLLKVVKDFYYHPSMGKGNGLKFVLPAILEDSSFLKGKYTKKIADLELTSRNFPDTHVWIKFDASGQLVNPYKSLPPIFEGWTDLEIDDTVSELEEIADGGAALTAYAKLQYTIMSDAERDKITISLLKYCELDTLAMAMLVEGLRELCKEQMI